MRAESLPTLETIHGALRAILPQAAWFERMRIFEWMHSAHSNPDFFPEWDPTNAEDAYRLRQIERTQWHATITGPYAPWSSPWNATWRWTLDDVIAEDSIIRNAEMRKCYDEDIPMRVALFEVPVFNRAHDRLTLRAQLQDHGDVHDWAYEASTWSRL